MPEEIDAAWEYAVQDPELLEVMYTRNGRPFVDSVVLLAFDDQTERMRFDGFRRCGNPNSDWGVRDSPPSMSEVRRAMHGKALEFSRLEAAGIPIKYMAKVLGVSTTVVYLYRRELGLPPRSTGGQNKLPATTCECCGEFYQPSRSKRRFCSVNCRAAIRSATRPVRECRVCGGDFRCRKGSLQTCCSSACASKIAVKSRKNVLEVKLDAFRAACEAGLSYAELRTHFKISKQTLARRLKLCGFKGKIRRTRRASKKMRR